jgi:hypothetical protein
MGRFCRCFCHFSNMTDQSVIVNSSKRPARQPTMISRRISPELCKYFSLEWRAQRDPLSRGRGEDRVRAAPAVSCANCASKTHTSIQVQRRQSGLPCAMVLTVSFALSPATNSSCHRRARCPGQIGFDQPARPWRQQRASGPRDFAVRFTRRRLRFAGIAHGPKPALQTSSAPAR